MKTNILILLFISATIFSCGNKEKSDSNTETLILTIQTSKAESNPLNIILNLGTRSIIIYNTTESFFETPPPPKSMSEIAGNYDSSFEDYETEVLKINLNEVDSVLEIVKNFDKDDYSSSIKTALDGTAITISIFYSNNSMRKIVLVNDSNDNHRKLFKRIFQIVESKTKQKKIIEKYYKKFN